MSALSQPTNEQTEREELEAIVDPLNLYGAATRKRMVDQLLTHYQPRQERQDDPPTLADVASPNPSPAAQSALQGALERSTERMDAIREAVRHYRQVEAEDPNSVISRQTAYNQLVQVATSRDAANAALQEGEPARTQHSKRRY